MKPKFYVACILIALLAICNKTNAQYANTSLSNLSSTKINVTLLPDKDKYRNLGNLTKAWSNLYLDSAIYLRGRLCFHTSGLVNTGIGENALTNINSGYDNTATGYNALTADSTGFSNTANGANALALNTTGHDNTAVGDAALYKNTTGYSNSAFGAYALEQANGHANTAFGVFALGYNTGNNNVAVGALALWQYSDASGQVAVGYSALNNLNGGSGKCTAVGSEAGYNTTTGSNNTYVGYHAGNTVTTGSSNTIIGYGADVGNATYNNSTALGNLTVVGGSNHVRIGNSSVTIIGGQVSWSTLSDARVKNNIQQNVPGLQFINLLKPVTYHFNLSKQENISGRKDNSNYKEKYDIEKIQFTGFLAQDVEAAAKKIGYDFSGVDVPKTDKDFYSLRYSDFVVPLVKAVQELSKQNDSLNLKMSEFENLKIENDELKSRLNAIEQRLGIDNNISGSTNVTLGSAALSQNTPNPFSNFTTIKYFLPQHYSSAKIIITDKNGSTLKQINLSSNKGSVNVDAATLSSGAYQYSLYVDGKLIASKQMITSK